MRELNHTAFSKAAFYFQTNWKGKLEEVCMISLREYLNLGILSNGVKHQVYLQQEFIHRYA